VPKKTVPRVDDPIADHKRYADEFLKDERYKKPKPNQKTKSDEANP
jgi:hypothetical protein